MWRLKTFRLVVLGVACCLIMQIFRSYDIPPSFTENVAKGPEPNEEDDAASVTITEKLVKDTEPNEGNDAPSVMVTENVVKGKEPNEEDDPPSVTVRVNVTKEIELSEEDYTPSVTKTDPNEEDDQANPLDSPPSHVGEYQINEISESLDRKTISRRNVVKKMMKHAWDSYVKYAWGANELRPVSKTSHSSVYFSTRLGTTIVDGLDTLYLMGLTDEFTHGREWVAQNFQMDSQASFNHEWVGERNSILSEIGSLSLEFGYLSDTTGDMVYYNKVDHVRRFLKSLHKPRGLYPTQLSPKTGEWGNNLISIGSYGDSFYEYLLKEWLRTGRKEDEVRQMYVEAMESIMNYMLTTSAGGLMYFGEIINDEVQPRMDHLACYSGGLLALGAITLDNDTLSTKHLQVAEAITSTCHETYASTATKLGPDQFYFTDDVAQPILATDKSYKLRPEVVESYFYMWRITKDPKYREWGWDVVQALNKHCRTSTGYSGITDVYSEETTMDDIQQSFFLAETLKYLYLLFSDDSLIPLSEWVFNTEGHPLPIKGNNCYFRAHNE